MTETVLCAKGTEKTWQQPYAVDWSLEGVAKCRLYGTYDEAAALTYLTSVTNLLTRGIVTLLAVERTRTYYREWNISQEHSETEASVFGILPQLRFRASYIFYFGCSSLLGVLIPHLLLNKRGGFDFAMLFVVQADLNAV
ncbi:hypothetical protein B0H17DRAFT_1129998 [Mycena rosella]|uniref:Uncharacterized protein n=1 Tax=Mycena rosella TaxID=1033263 RepID=A0AAD7DRJ1_MYCRO|nr:hypothetical protein B0H17DRAFT_1129998 [Mycena rosella]